MRALLETVEKVLAHDVNILILGESGVGKDYLAHAIHACSPQRDQPFVHVDCATIPSELFESELFGYEKGTFTDAQTRKIGKLETAGGGTIYFDEIAALTPNLQAKLLRAIEQKKVTRLGGHQSVPFEARLITSSNVDLDALLASGELRRDLFYRINVFTLMIPPLRERPEDIAGLAARFTAKRITREALDLLISHPWPGNVRELRNVVERASLLESQDQITPASLPPASPGELIEAAARRGWTLDDLEASYVREILRQTRSNYSKAAGILGINRKTLLEKRKKYGLE